jgi:hypothetical protein
MSCLNMCRCKHHCNSANIQTILFPSVYGEAYPAWFLLQLQQFCVVGGSSHEFLQHRQCFSPAPPLHMKNQVVLDRDFLEAGLGCWSTFSSQLIWKPSIRSKANLSLGAVMLENTRWIFFVNVFNLGETNCFNRSRWMSPVPQNEKSYHTSV